MEFFREGLMRLPAHPYRFIALVLVAAIVGILALSAFWRYINGPPYLLTIEPRTGGAAVQMVQRDSRAGGRLVSPTFFVPVTVEADIQVVLTSSDVAVPHGIIEFADTTLMPGRFRLRFGNVILDVMESRIMVDGVGYEWVPDDGGA